MFAFAIWDEPEQKLFAARDRFGEKPFYYIYTEDQFSFASEMKALRKPGLQTNINSNLLLQYLGNGFVQDATDAGATFDTNIFKLPARHYLTFKARTNQLSIIAYFDIDKSSDNIITLREASEQFRTLFFSSVEKRLRSDVEIGTSLSGGLDSSSVVAAIHHWKQTNAVQKTFTASFPGFEKNETSHAALVAKHFGLLQYFVSPGENDLVADLEKFLSQHDEPVSSSSVYAQYKVYQLAKQHGVKVILDGQGADEILAGYSKYHHWFLQELYNTNRTQFKIESGLLNTSFNYKNKLAAKLPGWAAISLERKAIRNQKKIPGISKDFVEESLNKRSIYKPVIKNLNDALYYDVFGGNLEELLRNADRNAMAHGIEVRLPFLNHELVQFVFSLSAGLKIQNGYSKYVLRQTMENMLPKQIVWRKEKVGFEPPQQQWMQNPKLQEKIHEAKRKLVQHNILKASALNTPVVPKAAHEAGNYDWRFLCAAHLL